MPVPCHHRTLLPGMRHSPGSTLPSCRRRRIVYPLQRAPPACARPGACRYRRRSCLPRRRVVPRREQVFQDRRCRLPRRIGPLRHPPESPLCISRIAPASLIHVSAGTKLPVASMPYGLHGNDRRMRSTPLFSGTLLMNGSPGRPSPPAARNASALDTQPGALDRPHQPQAREKDGHVPGS